MSKSISSNTSTKKEKWKGGRPPIKDKRTNRIHLLLNQNEKAILDKYVIISVHKTVNDFIRAMIFDKKVKIYYTDKSTIDIVFQLSKIGSNINQISYRLNAKKPIHASLNKQENEILNDLLDYLKSIRF